MNASFMKRVNQQHNSKNERMNNTMVKDKEFVEKVLHSLQDSIGEKYILSVTQMSGDNKALLTGITVRCEGKKLEVFVSLEPYFSIYQENMCIDDIVEDILEMIHNHLDTDAMAVKEINDFEKVKDCVEFKLINKRKNDEFLKTVPNIVFLDLAIVFYLNMGRSTKGQMSTIIGTEYLERWGTTVEELFQLALKNTPKHLPASLKSLRQVLKDIAKKNLGENYNETIVDALLGEEEEPFYVLSNVVGVNGAAVMIYPGVLKAAAETIGGDLLVLPSSRHEVLLLKKKDDMDFAELRDMVRSVNEIAVLDEDELSDEIYVYDRKNESVLLIKKLSKWG